MDKSPRAAQISRRRRLYRAAEPRSYRRAQFQVRHGVTGVPQVRHASVSRSLRRSYAVGAATDAAMRPVSSMAFRFERAIRGAQKMLYRSPRDT